MKKLPKEKTPVVTGEIYEMNIDNLGVSGEGTGKIENFTVFVKGALPGEKVSVQITEAKKNYAVGKIVKLLKESPARVKPLCPIYKKCGGCQLQHLTYETQLEEKQNQVKAAIEHIGGLKGIEILPVLGEENPWYYRNKMQFPVGKKKGIISIGCFAQGTHDIIDTEACLIQKQGNNAILQAMRKVIERLSIPPYNEDKHTGVLRHVIGRVGLGGELMIVLVTAVSELNNAKQIVKLLRSALPNLVSVQQNIQTYRNNVIMGRETKLLWGKETITDKIGLLKFRISPRSFFQVNSEQAEVLYNKALEFADLKGNEIVIDAYCGTGTISLFLAKKARKVYGIEIVKPAIIDARKNALDNNVKNVEFIVGDATEVMPRLFKQDIHPDVVVVDPPRAGCSEKVLNTFAKMNPQRIVYVSCNPATLARDLKILDELGYKTMKIQPVDMFPMTAHVECVALINRK